MRLHSPQAVEHEEGPRRAGPREQTAEGKGQVDEAAAAALQQNGKQFDTKPPPSQPSPSQQLTNSRATMQQVSPNENICNTSIKDEHTEHENNAQESELEHQHQHQQSTILIMTSLDDTNPNLHPTTTMTHINLDSKQQHLLNNHHQHQHYSQLQASQTQAQTQHLQAQPQQQQLNENQMPNGQPLPPDLAVNRPKPRGRRKKIRTEPIRPICPQCEKQFSNQSALTKHKLTHSDERRFSCPQCSKAFKRHDHLTGHMQTHSNRKPFTCNIQGCDKTYCDARSLRRHKENIHHIVTPRDPSTNTSFSQTPAHPPHHHHHHHQQPQDEEGEEEGEPQQQHQHQQQQQQPPPQLDQQLQPQTQSQQPQLQPQPQPQPRPHQPHQQPLQQQQQQQQPPQPQQHEPSHLLRRRIQRLHSDQPGAYNCNVDQLACFTVPPHSLGPPPPLTQPSGNSNHPHHLNPSHHHHNHQHNQYISNNGNNHDHLQHASFSADYASTQHFNFDFAHMNSQHGNHNHQHHTHHLSHQNNHHHPQLGATHNLGHSTDGHLSHLGTPLEHSPSISSMPHSADSVTDSGLGLNIHYEQQTPQPLGPPTRYSLQLSHPHAQQQQQHQQQQQAPQHHVSYSAGYATTQHFDFDLNNNIASSPGTNNNNGQAATQQQQQQPQQQQTPGSAQQAPQSACAFDFAPVLGNNQNQQQPLEHTLGTGSAPHSADSVTDSGLSLNLHYEQQLTPQPALGPPRYHHQHQVSYSAGYAATQHFDFDFNNNTLQARGIES